MSLSRWAVWIERVLALTGVALLVYGGVILVEGRLFQLEQTHALDVALQHQPAPSSDPAAATPLPATGDLIGSLEIPRLRLAVIVTQGDGESAFRVGLGHLPDTPFPWQGGNVAVAGHRDTFFRPLRNIAPGDRVRLRTPRGEFAYRVSQTLIVSPGDVWVLNPTERPTLTLITCYPFFFIGNAPRRFVVRAERVESPMTEDTRDRVLETDRSLESRRSTE